jgi:hypothetical protein
LIEIVKMDENVNLVKRLGVKDHLTQISEAHDRENS